MPATSRASSSWQLKNGFIAVVVCVFVAEGLVAGLDRSCMPSFDVGILGGQMLLLNAFFVPELLGLVAGVPAFFVAAAADQPAFKVRWRTLGFSGLAASAFLLAAWATGWFTLLVVSGTLASGALVGFWIREISEVRRFWLPIGITLALAVGAVAFLFGHYGQNNCWP